MRTTAIFGALGLAVGGAFALVLRLAGGRAVYGDSGAPRRYVDYLPTSAGGPGWTTVIAAALGTGLIAGLLVGVVVTAVVRRRLATGQRVAAGVAAAGLVIGALVAVQLRLSLSPSTPQTDFGWYSYSPLDLARSTRFVSFSDGVFYGGGPSPSWWPLVLTGVVVGAVAGLLVAAMLLLGRRRRAAA